MTFRDITNKNLKYNIRKYSSFFLVNAFVVCVLFLFGSLLFNDILNADAAIQAAGSMIAMAAVAITLFAIIFLTYTGIYFTRSRGREFGVYLTLGMTGKNLSRMVLLESALIFVASAVLGIIFALLLGNLFYLALARVLGATESLFFINYRSFLYSLGLLAVIFIVQQLLTARFIRGLSIFEIMKSPKTKGLAKPQILSGVLSSVAFALSIFTQHAIVSGADWIVDFIRAVPFAAHAPLVVMIVSMLFMIGSGVAGVAALMKRFPAFYNRNILLLAGLTHKFKAYRISLFNVTLLVTFAVFFIGIAMSFYIYGQLTLDTFQPHDFMIEWRGDINNISEDELRQIVSGAGGEVSQIHTLYYRDAVVYRTLNSRGGLFVNFRQNSFLVSESDFSRLMGQNFDVAPNELLIVTNEAEAYSEGVNFDTLLVVEHLAQGMQRAEAMRAEGLDRSSFMQTLEGVTVLEFTQANTSMLHLPFINSHGAMEFTRSHANVVDDEVFAMFANGQPNAIISFDLAHGEHDEIMQALLQELSRINNLPYGTWQFTTEFSLMDKDNIGSLRPISRLEREDILFRANSFLLFVMAFLGFLFMVSASIVLYCKFTADADEEKEHITQLKKIGLSVPECRRYLGSHIAIVFYLPLLLGGILGLVLNYSFVSMVDEAWFLVSRVAVMYSFVLVFGTAVYIALRKRFFKDVRV